MTNPSSCHAADTFTIAMVLLACAAATAISALLGLILILTKNGGD